ncbi:hypothetical protein Atai01_40320 [Amycolatopsis taiwanensis]|uniref:Uncharacterized protein n=1 Tax=Amycolatopsis taiwanensis TaxID=342230 RepID=A0A9W6R162_9PSEU|nr:hypothetical protein Atai01_40320 [Amycolatopsis taiwanensis]
MPRRCGACERLSGGYPADVEILFTTLLVIVAIAVLWFAFYVVYRLYADQR